jgi:TM2 domain-containing membrane protein YozV
MVISESTAVAFAGEPRFQKLKAVVLAVLLGHFGVHRIYLGTKANVPVFYSLTLGGGLGLLPLLDIVALLTVKDLDKYANSDQVIMWLRPKTTPQ